MEPEERDGRKKEVDGVRLPVYIGLVSGVWHDSVRCLAIRVPDQILEKFRDVNCFKKNNCIMITGQEEIKYPQRHKRHSLGRIKDGRLIAGQLRIKDGPRGRVRGYLGKEELLRKIKPGTYMNPDILKVIDLMYQEKEDVTN